MSDYRAILKENDLKSTHQRVAILQFIEKAGHIDIETLLEKLKVNYPTMSQGTLYRNLHDLKEKGILLEVKTTQQRQKYEIKKEPHIHLECEKCGRLDDFKISTTALKSSVEVNSGYKINSANVLFSGLCQNCIDE